MYSARPVGADFSYCGIYELSNIYACCETKNLDQSCAQFSPARDDETPHDCGTCRHQERVSPRVDVVLHQFLQSRSAGRTLLETTIEPSRAVAALSEFDACIDSAGFVHSRPAFLPHCAAMSTTDKPEGENRYLVGPVVNSAGRCAMWTPRTEPEFAAVDARLEALAERPARLHALGVELGMRRERLNALARQNSATAGYAVADEVRDAADRAALDDAHAGRLIAAETNAQADLIAFCLQQRGGSSELVASVTATWVPEGWVPDASFDDTYDLLDDVVLPAGGAVAPTTSPPDPPPSAPHPSAPPPSAPPASAPAPLAPAAAVGAAAVSAAAVSAAASVRQRL